MKIAISGKGGVGKTTLAGALARYIADLKYKVLAIDADPDANLASAIGISKELLKGVKPISEMKELISERTGAKSGSFGGMFILNPKVDDLPEKFSIEYKGVKMMLLGVVESAGTGCFCPENTLLKALLRHLFVARDEVVIVDMEAGLEHLSRGTTAYVNKFIVVVEPGQRSFQTARQIRDLAKELNVKDVWIVGNKIKSEEDRDLIKKELSDFSILGFLSYNDKIIESDKLGISPYDLSDGLRKEIEEIWNNINNL
ncbi:MAG: carbon monoxide dehydrogenase accessory protein CooC [Proteobacteria bacterium]|nr:carbon monoxide dehydrogenase accessory protein CooC [Pseudomonadota bacterium]